MTLPRSLLVVAAGLGLLQGGCQASSEQLDVAIDGVGLEPLEGNGGSQGGNGLPGVHLIADEELLWAATGMKIDDANNTSANILKNLTSETLKYAVYCAMPMGETVHGFTGQGILSTTSGWLMDALPSTEAKEDLFTCMIAHVNPYNVEVPFRLTGNHVNDVLPPLEAAKYHFEEALWVAREKDGGGIEYIVWPLDELKLHCPDTQNALLTRVCATEQGEMIPDCPVEVRDTTLNTDCQQNATTGNWMCLRQPAIKTWLNVTGYYALYGDTCDPIPQ